MLLLDVRKLEYFLAVCNNLNFAKAAKSLFISQQGLSIAINRLEKDLGCTLFLRTSRGLILTESGRHLKKCSEIIVHELKEYEEKIREKDIIRVACMHQILGILPDSVYSLLLNQNPLFPVNTIEAISIECEEMVKNEESDFCLTCDPLNQNCFSGHKLFPVDVSFIVNNQHYLARYDSISIHQLDKEKIAILNRKNKIYNVFTSWCTNAGYTPNIYFESGQPSMVCQIVKRNPDIIGVIPNYYSANLDQTQLKFLKLNDQETRGYIYLLHKTEKKLTKPMQDFEECFMKLFRQSNMADSRL